MFTRNQPVKVSPYPAHDAAFEQGNLDVQKMQTIVELMIFYHYYGTSSFRREF